MHIIKISPKSFKIILTKDDLAFSGADSAYESYGFSKEFFTKIIDEANRKYGADFGSGVIDASFFEDKCGGGELFLCESGSCDYPDAYAFFTKDSDGIIRLCKRIKPLLSDTYSSLYCNECEYALLLSLCDDKDFLLSVIKEYGECKKISRFEMWALQEHSKALIESKAIDVLSAT